MNVLPIVFGGVFTLASAYGLGLLLLRKLKAPPEVALAAGAAVESVAAFFIVLAGWAGWPAFLALGLAGIAAGAFHNPFGIGKGGIPRSGLSRRNLAFLAVTAIFAVYGIFYFVNALAPEVWADGYTYHLAMPADYLRLGGFPERARFYDMIPQGMEMLFTMAFAFGGQSAARLVEFGLFASGVPLIPRLGKKLGMTAPASLLVAVFYFTAPVIALTGASSYNDAALVFFTMAAFYLLLEWRESGRARHVFAAGLAAGFCYAIKFPGVFAIVAAAGFVALRKSRPGVRLRALAVFAAGVAVCTLPWLLRDLAATGDPFAPMMNAWFPNPYFYLQSERGMAANMRSWYGIPPWRVPWELAFGGHLGGIYGPLLFLLPVGLLALGRRAAQWCLAGAAVLSIAWMLNTGARFLMPAAVLAMFAVAMALPRPLVWAAITLEAVACWPQALDVWHPPYFRLHEFPWRAALRLEPEDEYLRSHLPDYSIARMVESSTPPNGRIFSLPSVAAAYLPRDVLVRWHSAEGEQIFHGFLMAFDGANDWAFDWKAAWASRPLAALRFRMPADNRMNFDLGEVELWSGGARLFARPQWALRAWPNIWDAPLAFDGLRTTVWNSWQPARKGMFLEVDLDRPQLLTGVTLASHTPLLDAPLEIYGREPGGRWILLARNPPATRHGAEDLRLQATAALRRAGFRYLLVNTGDDSLGPMARAIAESPAQWGLIRVAEARNDVLLRVW